MDILIETMPDDPAYMQVYTRPDQGDGVHVTYVYKVRVIGNYSIVCSGHEKAEKLSIHVFDNTNGYILGYYRDIKTLEEFKETEAKLVRNATEFTKYKR